MDELSDRFPELRAERLRVLLDLFRGVPALAPVEAIARTPLTPWGAVCAEAASDDDLALASAALNVEAELRREGWEAIERLGALLAGTAGSLDERLLGLPQRQFAEAAGLLLDLGWIDR